MKQDEIELLLKQELLANQMLNGVERPEISAAICPQRDLESFDSLNALEVIISIETKLLERGINCELDVSLFYTNKGMEELVKIGTSGCLSVKDISANIWNFIGKGGKK